MPTAFDVHDGDDVAIALERLGVSRDVFGRHVETILGRKSIEDNVGAVAQ
jgi:hypothetical protein